MVPLLVDPWLFQLTPTEPSHVMLARSGALRELREILRERSTQLCRFIASPDIDRFNADYRNYQRRDGREIAQILARLELSEEPQSPVAVLLSEPHPQSDLWWARALARSGTNENSPNWRDPIVLISAARSDHWARGPEIEYVVEGNHYRRSIVRIESRDEHPHFEPDFDPWRLGAMGTADGRGAAREMREARRRLPRPLHLLPLSLDFGELCQTLQNRIDWSCGHPSDVFYIPSQAWDPRTITKEHWRNGTIFPSKTVSGGRRGPEDREGRVWIWDPGENHHWDVQLPDGTHINVSHTGRIR